jgi:hypothetical protein
MEPVAGQRGAVFHDAWPRGERSRSTTRVVQVDELSLTQPVDVDLCRFATLDWRKS